MISSAANSESHSPLRVFQVVGSGGPGGVETFVLDLVRHFDPARFISYVCVIGRSGPMVAELREAGAETRVFGRVNGFDVPTMARYLRYLRSARPDIVHVHVGGRTARYLARVSGCGAVVSHVHGPPDEWIDELRANEHCFRHEMVRAFGSGSTRIIACSQWVADMLSRHSPLLTDRISVVRCGVDLVRFRPSSTDPCKLRQVRNELGLAERDVVVGFVGRLVRQKGIGYLLKLADVILPQYSNVRFLVIGEGPLRQAAEAAAHRLGQRRLILLGERRDVPSLLSLIDILVAPSEWEPLGIAILEAMAMARPVVAFAVDGIPEVILEGETGFMVPPGDEASLARAVSRLIEDPELGQRMGSAGRARVERHFDLRDKTRAIISLYEAMLRPRAGIRPQVS